MVYASPKTIPGAKFGSRPVGPEVGMRSWRSMASLMVASILGCNSGAEPNASPGKIAFSDTDTPAINGSVFLGTGQRSICSAFPAGSPFEARAIGADGNFFDPPEVTFCPENQFSIAVSPGSYLLRVALPIDLEGLLPARWLEPGPVTVDQTDVIKDLHVRNGSPLRGGATLDGAPLSGIDLFVMYASAPAFGAAFGASGSTGEWGESFGRSPMILQNNLDYILSGCFGPFPGTRPVEGFPTEPIHFPGGTNRADCRLLTGDALRFTHRASRLKLTSYPGDIGGLSEPSVFPRLGYGYSAQFPLAPGAVPQAGPGLLNRQLFRGGLVLAVAPDVALSGTELGGYVFCSVSPCRALGLDGRATVTRLAGARREITWDYTDAGSERPRGLQVRQKSFDGQNDADYVLYVFRVTNRGTTAITFTPGLFIDFDVPELFDNIGYTELGGRLMITTGAGDAGNHLGTVIVRSPAVGRNYFFRPGIAEADVVAALRGVIRRATSPEPSDLSTLHGGSTVTLGRGRSTDVWAAIVAGDNRTQTISHARAAINDARARQASGDPFGSLQGDSERSGWETVQSLGAGARAATSRLSGPSCKAGCRLD
jgi:hypothetical protein